ncbi:unnamed protein product [Rotaria sordida]|uniref:ABC-2 type transporter transmembrane domain-containing protein n=1 Tax=Rotaria sordida TaxID=392033 RepID=A0A815FUN3_9BILA|nr:unnamed protein product [Rotaria sordida]CAF1588555.1 unnamed protein product [Rotaria sordida]
MEIAACPKVLLDEPTSGLDTVSCDDLFDLLQLIKHNLAGLVTIIMVIHQPSQELFEKIDDIFFLTSLCCLAYQGPREKAKDYLKQIIFASKPQECPPSPHNDCTCDIQVLPTIDFLMSLSFGILTCISSQRLFGVEITDDTFERESRNYFHPFQYWLAKSLVDIFRMILYPLLFLSMLYIEIVPRGPCSYYLGVMILLSFVCSGIGQLTLVIFRRTEYAYLGGTIVALLSCLLSGFSPTKSDLGRGKFIVFLSFSRHVQSLLFSHEKNLYLQTNSNETHIWSSSIERLKDHYSFGDQEIPYFFLIFLGFLLRGLTFLCLYAKSEYRSERRFRLMHIGPTLKSLFTCQTCRR